MADEQNINTLVEGVPHSWEGHEVVIDHASGGSGDVISADSPQGLLKKVNDVGIVLRIEQHSPGGIREGLYFFPWNSIIYIHLVE